MLVEMGLALGGAGVVVRGRGARQAGSRNVKILPGARAVVGFHGGEGLRIIGAAGIRGRRGQGVLQRRCAVLLVLVLLKLRMGLQMAERSEAWRQG